VSGLLLAVGVLLLAVLRARTSTSLVLSVQLLP
jgi:hypothetical protein